MPNTDRPGEFSTDARGANVATPEDPAQAATPSRETEGRAGAWCGICGEEVPEGAEHDCAVLARKLAEGRLAACDVPVSSLGPAPKTVSKTDSARGSTSGARHHSPAPGQEGHSEREHDGAQEGASGPRDGEGEGVSAVVGAPSLNGSPDQPAELAIRESDLLAIEKVAEALERCVAFDEFRDVRDTATLMRLFLRERKASLASQNRAAEVRLRAERRMGEILRALKIRRGRKSEADPVDVNPALSEIQVTEKESSVWQRLSKLDPAVFEKRIALANENSIELRTAWMLKGPPPASMQRANDLAAAAERAQATKSCLPGRIEDVARLLLASFTRDDLDRLGRIIAGGAAKDEQSEEDAA